MRPTESTLKQLFALSGNRCPIPNCKATLVYNGRLIGEVCHIKGDNPGAARYDPLQTDKERQSYENLVAMCPTHHTVIDDDAESYPTDRILKMKAEHEAKVIAMTDADAESAARNFLEIGFANIGQTGGIAAQHFQAHTVNLHSAPVDPLAQKRQLQAIETLWKAVKDLRKEFGQLVHVDNIFASEEIGGFFQKGWPKDSVRCWTMRVIVQFSRATSGLARWRPNPSVSLCRSVSGMPISTFARYTAGSPIFSRNRLKRTTTGTGAAIQGPTNSLRATLPPNVVEQLKSKTIGGLHSAFDYLEEQFLAEANMRR